MLGRMYTFVHIEENEVRSTNRMITIILYGDIFGHRRLQKVTKNNQ